MRRSHAPSALSISIKAKHLLRNAYLASKTTTTICKDRPDARNAAPLHSPSRALSLVNALERIVGSFDPSEVASVMEASGRKTE